MFGLQAASGVFQLVPKAHFCPFNLGLGGNLGHSGQKMYMAPTHMVDLFICLNGCLST